MSGSPLYKASLVALVLGTVVASLGGARLPRADTTVSVIGLALLVAGIIGVRLVARTRAQEGSSASDGLGAADPLSLLRAIPERLEPLIDRAPTAPLPEIVREIAAVVDRHFTPLSEVAPSMLGRLGAARFATVFGSYASAERAIARAWSAAADGHRAEAVASLGRAKDRIHEALRELE